MGTARDSIRPARCRRRGQLRHSLRGKVHYDGAKDEETIIQVWAWTGDRDAGGEEMKIRIGIGAAARRRRRSAGRARQRHRRSRFDSLWLSEVLTGP